MEATMYKTLTEAVNDLEQKGYTHEFILDSENECAVCHQKDIALSPEHFQIDAVYRFYGQSDVDDETIVYAISSEKHNIKGLIIDAFGIYGDNHVSKLVAKLNLHASKEKKPIKRHTTLIKFSREHHFGLLLCWKIRQGIKYNIDTKRISDHVLFFFDNDLKKHFEEEEKILFPKLLPTDTFRLRAEAEHKTFYEQINLVRLGNANYELLTKIADTLEKHIRFEEREMFNYIQQKLSEAELIELGKQHAHRACDIDDKWNDHFWKTK